MSANTQEQVRSFVVEHDADGMRLDVAIHTELDITRSQAKKLCDDGAVTVDDKPCKSAQTVRAGSVVRVVLPPVVELDLSPQDLPLRIVYEDDDIAVVDKPQGMVVHPAPGAYDGTMVHALLYHLQSLSAINGVMRPGIVHRLDKDTSGLLVVAKNDAAHVHLQAQIAEKSAHRVYLALCDGVFAKECGTIDTYLERSAKDRKKIAVSRDNRGRRAITHYRVIKRYARYTLTEFVLETGRTHQIRVHARHIGHPVVGDPVYGGSDKFGLNGQLLHAARLELTHPVTGKRMIFCAPLPPHFVQVLDQIEHQSTDSATLQEWRNPPYAYRVEE